jgi:hypothetical protein
MPNVYSRALHPFAMKMLRKTKSDCVVSISLQELAAISSALDAQLASEGSTKASELRGLLSDLAACQKAAPTPLGVPEVLQQLVALALASRS